MRHESRQHGVPGETGVVQDSQEHFLIVWIKPHLEGI